MIVSSASSRADQRVALVGRDPRCDVVLGVGRVDDHDRVGERRGVGSVEGDSVGEVADDEAEEAAQALFEATAGAVAVDQVAEDQLEVERLDARELLPVAPALGQPEQSARAAGRARRGRGSGRYGP